jgi:hypothetical protein
MPTQYTPRPPLTREERITLRAERQIDAAQAAIEYQAQQTHKLANMRRLRGLRLQEKHP